MDRGSCGWSREARPEQEQLWLDRWTKSAIEITRGDRKWRITARSSAFGRDASLPFAACGRVTSGVRELCD